MIELVQQHPSGGYILEELRVGMAAEKVIEATEERIRRFAEASDDFNPVHLDEEFAAKTAYRGRIAHGLLSASFGSAVVGTILPGAGSIYVSQTLQFHLPVRVGDTVLIRITVVDVDQEAARLQLNCEGFVDGKLIMDGIAVVRVPRRRKPSQR
jgi:3-hydroxybutyryl-CoA dehydratase